MTILQRQHCFRRQKQKTGFFSLFICFYFFFFKWGLYFFSLTQIKMHVSTSIMRIIVKWFYLLKLIFLLWTVWRCVFYDFFLTNLFSSHLSLTSLFSSSIRGFCGLDFHPYCYHLYQVRTYITSNASL